jgi:hypothetical protein
MGQLRHLYAQMVGGHVKNTKRAAEGLLSPAIAELETVEAAAPTPGPDALSRAAERVVNEYRIDLHQPEPKWSDALFNAVADLREILSSKQDAQAPGEAGRHDASGTAEPAAERGATPAPSG